MRSPYPTFTITLSLAHIQRTLYTAHAHTLSIERTAMSFIPIPASCAWLQTTDDSTVRLEHYRMCLIDYAEWLRANGVPDDHIADPHTFVADGDLQLHSNVVSEWPKDAPATHRAPTLYTILMGLRIVDGSEQPRFFSILEWHVKRMREWLVGNRRDPDNPNETKEQREARLNRERVARHRLRHAAGSDDPELNRLLQVAKAAVDNVTAGRKWIKGAERQAKADMDAAIAAAKAARAATVSSYQQALQLAEQQAHAAQEAVEQYRLRN
jgi:hypothetical protein